MDENPMDNELGTIARFLEKLALPAEGFARNELSPEEESLLSKLAAGELNEEERSALIPLLAHNELAMEFLAGVA